MECAKGPASVAANADTTVDICSSSVYTPACAVSSTGCTLVDMMPMVYAEMGSFVVAPLARDLVRVGALSTPAVRASLISASLRSAY